MRHPIDELIHGADDALKNPGGALSRKKDDKKRMVLLHHGGDSGARFSIGVSEYVKVDNGNFVRTNKDHRPVKERKRMRRLARRAAELSK